MNTPSRLKIKNLNIQIHITDNNRGIKVQLPAKQAIAGVVQQ
jgi:hypothetical protein